MEIHKVPVEILTISLETYNKDLNFFFKVASKSVARGCSVKKVFLKISQNSQENSLFLIK